MSAVPAGTVITTNAGRPPAQSASRPHGGGALTGMIPKSRHHRHHGWRLHLHLAANTPYPRRRPESCHHRIFGNILHIILLRFVFSALWRGCPSTQLPCHVRFTAADLPHRQRRRKITMLEAPVRGRPRAHPEIFFCHYREAHGL